MSRRSRTILTLSVSIPVPPGYTQKQTVETITQHIKAMTPPFAPQEVVVSVERRETVYL